MIDRQISTNKGFALIVVLWVLTLLAIMASSFALTIQRETAIISGVKEKAEASALAEAGINYAILMLFSSDEDLQWQAFNSLYEVNYTGKRVRIQISDESGLIDINGADKEQLQALFDSINIGEADSDSLSDAILDWRDANDEQLLNGAEKDQYADAGLKYEPRNKPFASVEELQMVLGMNPDIYQQLQGMISIYSHASKVNPATASRAVLLTLPDVDEEMVDQYLQQRIENERNGEDITAPEWYRGSARGSGVYQIVAEVMIDKGVTQQTMAVIKKAQSGHGLPFQTLKWVKDYQQASLFLPENDMWIIN